MVQDERKRKTVMLIMIYLDYFFFFFIQIFSHDGYHGIKDDEHKFCNELLIICLKQILNEHLYLNSTISNKIYRNLQFLDLIQYAISIEFYLKNILIWLQICRIKI